MVLQATRTAIAVIITCALQGVTLSFSAPLKELPGKRAGVFAACKSSAVQVKTSSKGKYQSFKSYQAAEVKKLTKKLKGKPKNVVKASISELTKSLKTLQTNLSKECKKSSPCFNPNTLVLNSNGTSSCETSKVSCIMSTIRCTQSVPGSCACDRKPSSDNNQAKPSPTPDPERPQPTPTPTPTPDLTDVSVSLSLESVGTFRGYRVFLIGNRPSKAGVVISSSLTSISDNGILAGGYFVQPPWYAGGTLGDNPLYLNGVSFKSGAIYRGDEMDFTIVPFLSSKGSFTTPCTLATCPKGIVLNTVNEFGIATGNATTYEDGHPARGTAYLFNGPKAQLSKLSAGTSTSVCVRGLNDLNTALGVADCYQASEQHLLWNNVNSSPVGSIQKYDQTSLLRFFDLALKQQMLDLAKAEARKQSPQCTEKQINETSLSDFQEPYGPPKITMVGTNNLGDVLGNMNYRFEATYKGPCLEVWSWDPRDNINFVMTKDGRLTFIDLISYLERDYVEPGYFISDSRLVAAQNSLYGIASRIDTKVNPMRWSSSPFNSFGFEFVMIAGTNARGDTIGFRGNHGGHAEHYIYRDSTSVSVDDLVDQMALGPNWQLQSLNDINECGEVVGAIGNYLTFEHRGILLSPPGCR